VWFGLKRFSLGTSDVPCIIEFGVWNFWIERGTGSWSYVVSFYQNSVFVRKLTSCVTCSKLSWHLDLIKNGSFIKCSPYIVTSDQIKQVEMNGTCSTCRIH
jgi:hypothetical protein